MEHLIYYYKHLWNYLRVYKNNSYIINKHDAIYYTHLIKLFIQGFISNHFSTSNQKNNGWEQNWIIIYFLLMASNFCFTRKESIYQRWKEAKAFVDFKQAYFVKGIYLNILSTNPNSKVPINMQQITDNELIQ
jgi:hypothetical protein